MPEQSPLSRIVQEACSQQAASLTLAGAQNTTMMLQQNLSSSCKVSSRASSRQLSALRPASRSRRQVVTKAAYDTNIFLNLVTSTACGAMAAAVTLVTAEDTDKEVRSLD